LQGLLAAGCGNLAVQLVTGDSTTPPMLFQQTDCQQLRSDSGANMDSGHVECTAAMMTGCLEQGCQPKLLNAVAPAVVLRWSITYQRIYKAIFTPTLN
jgi:hypothetical protein